MPLIKAIRELCGNVTTKDMQMIADINRIILNLQFMSDLLKKIRSPAIFCTLKGDHFHAHSQSTTQW